MLGFSTVHTVAQRRHHAQQEEFMLIRWGFYKGEGRISPFCQNRLFPEPGPPAWPNSTMHWAEKIVKTHQNRRYTKCSWNLKFSKIFQHLCRKRSEVLETQNLALPNIYSRLSASGPIILQFISTFSIVSSRNIQQTLSLILTLFMAGRCIIAGWHISRIFYKRSGVMLTSRGLPLPP